MDANFPALQRVSTYGATARCLPKPMTGASSAIGLQATVTCNCVKIIRMDKLRIDKWLWAARFYKTRSLALEEIGKGRVQINDQDVKPSREVKVGDTLVLRQGVVTRTLVVRGISSQRGPAPVAQQLYEETAQSVALRAQAAEQRRLHSEPASSLEHGRPTKRDRRNLDKAHSHDWDSRWSASSSR